jgi:hypothetical protein
LSGNSYQTSRNRASGFGNFVGSLLGGGASLLGGHRALGGDVVAGQSYDIGEMGREKFAPSTNGTITPNNKLTGNTTMHIDARGSNNLAQTEAAIHRAMGQYAPHIVAASQRGNTETQKRKPTGAH